MAKYTLLVLTNPVEGREDSFNDWYTNTHIKDVVNVPGIVAAQRFKLAGAQLAPAPHPWGYLALYDVETDNLEHTVKALQERIGTSAMVMSDAMSPQLLGFFYEPITDRVTSNN
jgi:hypothetical protein